MACFHFLLPCLGAVYKLHLKEEVSRKVVKQCPLFVNIYTLENVNAGGVGGQKSQNLYNIVCERPLPDMILFSVKGIGNRQEKRISLSLLTVSFIGTYSFPRSFISTKGQIILKANYLVLNSSKKTNEIFENCVNCRL